MILILFRERLKQKGIKKDRSIYNKNRYKRFNKAALKKYIAELYNDVTKTIDDVTKTID